MGTTRRTFLWLAGIAAFGAAYLLYNWFLGWIDGLPALPERYLQVAHAEALPDDSPRQEPKIVRMLRQAFGENCREAKYPIKLSVQSQGLLTATVRVDFEDGRVRLAPFSMVMFGKINPETAYPEINTIHCDVGYITFDRPIRFWTDMSQAKLVAAEFLGVDAPLDPNRDPRSGKIWAVHNHCTPQADDDFVISTRGPLYYHDQSEQNSNIPQLWTDSVVDMTDYQSKPPHKVDAVGMKIFLSPNAARAGADRKSAAGNKGPSQQVRKLQLASHVNMNLVLDGNFPGHAEKRPNATGAGVTHLFVWNPGSFLYDFETDRAYFDLPPPDPAKLAPDVIRVVRELPDKQTDQLLCQRLQLQLQRKNAGGPPASTAPNQAEKIVPRSDSGSDSRGLEIMTMTACGDIALSADSENVRAFGAELDYDHALEQTTVRGAPATVMRDSSIIRCPEIRMIQRDAAVPTTASNELAEIGRCVGPGQARLINDRDGKQLDVSWRDLLLVQQEGPLQRVTITGNAICDQHAERQHLEGDLIRLWLKEADSPISPIVPVQAVAGVSGSASRAAIREATPQTATAPSDPSDSNERKKKPHKVLVVGHVAARSPEMILRNAKQLTVWFQDVPKLPASRPTSSDPRLPPSSGPGSERDVTQATNVQTERGQNAPSAGPPSGQEPPKVPLEVSAEIVETFVMRNNSGTELDRLFCKDHVEVHQDPKDPKDRALNIHSHELELIHTADGDRLRLKGLAEDLAMVEAQTMTLFGPRVIFDQKDNRAEMENGGKMQLPASSSLNGEQLEKPSDIVVRWNGKMKFNGRSATFDGNVVAEQDGIRVTCPQMHVFLDRQVSFKRLQQNNMTSLGPDKEPKQEDEQPQVKKVICCRSDANTNDPVVITEQVWRDGKLVRHQLIIAPQVVFLNDEGRLHADGPAEVRTLQFGEKMGPEAAGNDKTPKAPVQELQLTRILFQGRMEANNKTRKTTFTGQVRLAHLPAEQIDLRIDEDHLPTSGFTLRCEQLTASFRLEGERKIPTMEARIRSEIQSDEFSGRADEIYYDEGKNQQITFMGLSDNPAELTHSEVRGKEGRQFSGKTIIYWRKTNQIKATDSAGGTIPQ